MAESSKQRKARERVQKRQRERQARKTAERKGLTPKTSGRAVMRPTEEGGSVIVTSKGSVTVRDESGQVVERFKADTSQAEKFISEQNVEVEKELKARKSRKTSSFETAPVKTGVQPFYAEITDQGLQGGILVRDTSKTGREQFQTTGQTLTPESVEALKIGGDQVKRVTETEQQRGRREFEERLTSPKTVSAGTQTPTFRQRLAGEFVSGATFKRSSTLAPTSQEAFTTGFFGRDPSGRLADTSFKGRVKQGLLEASYVAGVVGSLSGLSKVGQVSKAVITQTGRLGAYVGKVAPTIAVETGKAVVTVQGIKTIGAFTSKERDLIKTDAFKSAFRKGLQAERESKTRLGRIAQDVTLFASSKRSQEVFKQTVKEELVSKGFSPSEVEAGVSEAVRKKRFSASGELVGLLQISRASELLGRKLTAGQTFKGGAGFVKSAGLIGTAGFQEGLSQSIISDVTRERPVSPVKALKTGALGFGTAGVIGGAIVTLPSRSSGFLQGASYISDPYEYLGDKLADISVKGARKGVTPVFTFVDTLSADGSPSSVSTFTSVQQADPKVFAKTTTLTFANTKSAVFVPTPAETSVLTQAPAITSISSKTPSNVPIQTQIPVQPSVPVTAQIPVQASVPVQTNVPVSTAVNTFTSTNVPVFTPNIKLPPVPLGFGGGGFSFGKPSRFRRQARRYTPSFTGAVLGVKRSKVRDITGLSVRGV